MKHLHNKGDVVNVFQLSMSKGLLLEGKATIVKPIGEAQDEHYMVTFHSDLNKYPRGRCPSYERFIDREGQDDALAYIEAFNKRLGLKAA
jgi:hypothetical protein